MNDFNGILSLNLLTLLCGLWSSIRPGRVGSLKKLMETDWRDETAIKI